jgi:hypothetical protein
LRGLKVALSVAHFSRYIIGHRVAALTLVALNGHVKSALIIKSE